MLEEEQLPPLLSIRSLTKSLHPLDKLWTEISTTGEQDEAIKFVSNIMKKYGVPMIPKGKTELKLRSMKHGT